MSEPQTKKHYESRLKQDIAKRKAKKAIADYRNPDYDPYSLADNWKIFGDVDNPKTIIELRHITDDGQKPPVPQIFRGEKYANKEELKGIIESTAKKLNEEGFKSYIVMNKIKPHYHPLPGKYCGDKDIDSREWMLIDIDIESETRQPATDFEVEEAQRLAIDIEAHLVNEGWPKPAMTDSGNGVHLYFRLADFDNTPEDRELIKNTLYRLDALFSSNNLKIDKTVHNASRITKFLGTVAYKGEATKERPYRRARLLQESDGKVERAKVVEFVEPYLRDIQMPKTNGAAAPSKVPSTLETLLNDPYFQKSVTQERNDLRNALQHLSPNAKHGVGKFEDDAYWSAVILSIASLGDDFKDIALEWSNQEGANFSIEAFNKCWDSYDPTVTGYGGKKKTIASLYGYVNQITSKPTGSRFGQMGDIANGEKFAKQFKGQILFTRDTDDAYIFDKAQGWCKADSDAQITAAKIIAVEMGKRAIKWKQEDPESKPAQLAINEAVRSSKRQGLEAMVWSARSVEGMSVNASQLDTEPHLLGVKNGILNLDTGELLKPDPKLLVTKRANVTFDPDARCPRYVQFLKECIPNRDEINFKLKWSGYRMSGHTTEQLFLFDKGDGANGKTKDQECSKYVLGDYAAKFKTEVLISSERNPQGHDADLISFQGLRFAFCNETSEGRFLNEQQVKELVDEGTLTGRVPYGKKQISFPITHKIEIAGNHAPIVRGTDDGIWRRIIVFNWPIKFHDPNDSHPEGFTGPFRDPNLLDKLKAEASGILNIWLKGYQEWKKSGLQVPDSLRKATNVFRSDSDLLGQWLEEDCVIAANEKIDKKRLFRAYRRWCEEGGYNGLTQNSFSRSLRERGFSVASDKRTLLGIALIHSLDGGLG